jgi:hypothetical protein
VPFLVEPAKTGHGPHSSKFLFVVCIFVLFCVLFVCICVLYYCHRVATQLQLYTECHRRKGQYFGSVFLMLNYTEKTQNTYIQSIYIYIYICKHTYVCCCAHLPVPCTFPTSPCSRQTICSYELYSLQNFTQQSLFSKVSVYKIGGSTVVVGVSDGVPIGKLQFDRSQKT